jgi:hypothetical protein
MNIEEAYKAMNKGQAIRRPCWLSGYHMVLTDGLEETRNGECQHLAFGYRELGSGEEINDYEIFPVPRR